MKPNTLLNKVEGYMNINREFTCVRVELSSRGIISEGILRGGIIIRDWRWREGMHAGVQCWEDLMPWSAWSNHQKPFWRSQQIY